MLKSHEDIYSTNGKRQVLVVDDEAINRELLALVLQDEYDLFFASDGHEAIETMRTYADTLSLVLLDLMMPNMSGKEVLRTVKADPLLAPIPVIVLTADQAAEIESLDLGASDFIPKPYPNAGVIMARVRRSIELSEEREAISYTERDPLTGLYNREYFYLYAELHDQHHKATDMDAIVVDINHFHILNERFGTVYGDEVLRRIGQRLRDLVADEKGIVCRREADTFMVYVPHGKDYDALLHSASVGLTDDDSSDNRVRLRMGVYPVVDKDLEIARRFDRAKMAADSVRNSFAMAIGTYDRELHERELYDEQLVEDFPAALETGQFEVFFQPKFDIRPEIPVLSSAEALVRWFHPHLGMISPGVFIPLFERNGLIQRLDEYVWRTAAARIADWKRRFGLSIPVSVNVSRIDMYDPDLIDTISRIVSEGGLTPDDLYLEITESAYTQSSKQIIDTVSELRRRGFRIEMDDFGTGYSSLNMISSLPIDALKLDMQFIRAAFNGRRDTRMIEVIIDIADYLNVPVIAEGVETAEQLAALRAMGCDIVQGYYFSRPVPAHEYERFVAERREQADDPDFPGGAGNPGLVHVDRRDTTIGKIAFALSSGFEHVYYVDVDTNRYVEFGSEGRSDDLQIQRSGQDFFADAQLAVMRSVHEADRALLLLCMQKASLLEQLVDERPFSMTFRLLMDGEATYYTMKAVRSKTHDDHHIVVGLSNVDAQIRQTGGFDRHGHAGTNELDFNGLARALSNDMESIYYVDTATDTYQEFVTHGSYETLELEISGKDFFDECARNIQAVVFEDDRERMTKELSKESLLRAIGDRQVLTLDYRLVIDGAPQFYRLKAMPAQDGAADHIIIGVSNIDSQISDDRRLEAERQSAGTYASIAQALAQDYFSIYYVDTKTDHFIEYSSHEDYRELGIETSGEDFFTLSRKNIARVVHPDDLGPFLEAFTKRKVLEALERDGAFTITYRLLFNGTPTYVHMKATPMPDRNDPHIVIGVSNIDAQMRREQEHTRALRSAREAAYRDPLTGVKSKRAYAEDVEALEERLSAGNAEPFALALCDVNDLKAVNDSLGHEAGDELIRGACRIICHVFEHSPVYRYGGDEFVALLRGGDYERRDELVASLAKSNEANRAGEGPVIACGLSEFVSGTDFAVSTVFKRADDAMYADKRRLKGAAA